MTIEEIAKTGDWCASGDVGPCDVGRCHYPPTNYAEVRTKDTRRMWYFCGKHFAEYLRLTDELRERARSTPADKERKLWG